MRLGLTASNVCNSLFLKSLPIKVCLRTACIMDVHKRRQRITRHVALPRAGAAFSPRPLPCCLASNRNLPRYMYIHKKLSVYIYTLRYPYIYIYRYVGTHTHNYVHINSKIYIYIYIIHIYTCNYTHTYNICTYIYLYLYIPWASM